MYNGVGLETARGSGTSGYIQKNLSHIQPWQQFKRENNYQKVLQQFRDNPAPLPRAPNRDLLEHEQKHKIEAQLFKLELELKSSKKEETGEPAYTEDEIQEILLNSRKVLTEKLKAAPTIIDAKESHQAALAKEKQMEKLKSALKVGETHEFGAAFDVDL